jgi:uncharacterized protein (TIGR02452 family)
MDKTISEQNKLEWINTKYISKDFQFTMAEKLTINCLEFTGYTKKIQIFNMDILVAAEHLHAKKFKPLILVNSRAKTPGEGLDVGDTRLEEEIFRRTNCSAAINENLYPFESNECLYFDATIIKDEKYIRLAKPVLVSCIFSAPIIGPSIIQIADSKGQRYAYSEQSVENIMKEKIFGFFKTAHELGFDCVLIPAWGCDFARNPIELIVEYFNLAIKKYCIKYVFFAIKDSVKYKYFNTHIKRS